MTAAPRAWFIDVAEDQPENELTFLQADTCQREVDLLVRQIDAYDRFSDRC